MVEINLLPQQYRKQTEPSAWKFATYALIPLTVAAILIPEVATYTRISDLQRQIADLNGVKSSLASAKQEYDQLSREKTNLQSVTAVATQLKEGKTYWTNDLAAFTSQMPRGGGVAIQNMTIRSVDEGNLSTLQQSGTYVGKKVVREIELSGQASSQQAVVNFLRTFENSPNFGVNFKSLQSDPQTGQYTFTASVGIVGTPDTAQPGTPGGSAAPVAPTSEPAANATGGGNVN